MRHAPGSTHRAASAPFFYNARISDAASDGLSSQSIGRIAREARAVRLPQFGRHGSTVLARMSSSTQEHLSIKDSLTICHRARMLAAICAISCEGIEMVVVAGVWRGLAGVQR